MQKTLSTLKSLIIVLALTIGLSYVFAWTGPTGAPPNDNAPAPINVGGTSQAKTGGLGLGGSKTTAFPSASSMLDVLGNISGQGLLLSGKGYSTNDFCIVDPITKAETKCLSEMNQAISCPLNTDTFANPGTTSWTAPTGVTQVTVKVWGAGGGGGGGGVDNAGAGGGGGSGGYSSSVLTVVPGTSYSITIGAGGAGGGVGSGWHNGGSNGSAGNSSRFVLNGGTSVVANGGGGGIAAFTYTGGAGATVGTGDVALAGNQGPNGSTYYQTSSPGGVAPNSLGSYASGGPGGASVGNTGSTSGGSGQSGAVTITYPQGANCN